MKDTGTKNGVTRAQLTPALQVLVQLSGLGDTG